MRLRTLIVFGAGYIWGARTGHERLVDLTDRVRDLLDSDVVHDYLQRAQGAAAPKDDEDRETADAVEPGSDEEPESFEEPEDEEFEEPEDAESDEPEESEDDADGGTERTERRRNVRRRAPGRTRR